LFHHDEVPTEIVQEIVFGEDGLHRNGRSIYNLGCLIWSLYGQK
jgi:hypothetical protein